MQTPLRLCAFGLAFLISHASAVEFSLDSSALSSPPKQVWAAGDFNNWSPEEYALQKSQEKFAAEIAIPDGIYGYRFRILDENGSEYWICDPTNSDYVPSPNGTVNSLLQVENGTAIRPADTGMETFEYIAPEAGYVNLAGDFNGWEQGEINLLRDENGIWRCRVKIERPIVYKFIVDGIWKTDPAPDVETMPDNFGGENSFRPAEKEHPNPLLWSQADIEAKLEGLEVRKGEETAQAWELALKGKYEPAIALCLKSQLRSTTTEETAAALMAEAEVHRHFGYRNRAAHCWWTICTEHDAASQYEPAARELAKHFIEEFKKFDQARYWYKQLLPRVEGNPQKTASVWFDIAMTHIREEQWDEALAALNEAYLVAPRPDTSKDLDYAQFWVEMLGYEGIALYHTGKLKAARTAFERMIDLSPYPDSEAVQHGRMWLETIANAEAAREEATR